jgi:polyadenylate-binding protein
MNAAGKIDSIHIAKDEEGKSLGFGFCNYPIAEDAAKAVEMFDQKEVEGDKLYVGRAMKKAKREKFLKDKYERMKIERAKKYSGVNLYVKHLDDSIDDERLRKEFEKFGNITSAKVMREPSGRSKGFGFVCFESTEQSTRAMAEMNSKIVEGKPLYVALAQRKEVRRQNLEKEFHERRSNQNPKNPGRGQGGPPSRGRGFRGQQRPPNAYPQNYLFNGRMGPQQMMFQQPPMNRGFMRGNPIMPGGMGRQMPYNNMPMVPPGNLQQARGRPNRGPVPMQNRQAMNLR